MLSPKLSYAQAEVYTEPAETEVVEVEKVKVRKQHSPQKAVLLSAALPGLGQIYNKKYWKLPIIYAGFGGLGYSIFASTRNYRKYKTAYKYRVDGDPNTIDEFEGTASESNLLDLKNYYRRNLDLGVIFTAVLYALNLVDAAVDAHLFHYDISDDLSMQVQPRFNYNAMSGSSAGVTIILGL